MHATLYMAQKQDSTCVAVAIMNACRYLKLDSPDFDQLTVALCCRTGAAIHTKAVVKKVFGDRLVSCDNFHEFSNVGGILTIHHPIVNLHSMFCYPEGDGYTLVNSWLGPNIMKNIGYEEIVRFLPKDHLQDFWKIGE